MKDLKEKLNKAFKEVISFEIYHPHLDRALDDFYKLPEEERKILCIKTNCDLVYLCFKFDSNGHLLHPDGNTCGITNKIIDKSLLKWEIKRILCDAKYKAYNFLKEVEE